MMLAKTEPLPAWHNRSPPPQAQRQRPAARGRAAVAGGRGLEEKKNTEEKKKKTPKPRRGRGKTRKGKKGRGGSERATYRQHPAKAAAERCRDEGLGAAATSGGTAPGWPLGAACPPRSALPQGSRNRLGGGAPRPSPAPTAIGRAGGGGGKLARAAPLPRPGAGGLPCGVRSRPVVSRPRGRRGGEGEGFFSF